MPSELSVSKNSTEVCDAFEERERKIQLLSILNLYKDINKRTRILEGQGLRPYKHWQISKRVLETHTADELKHFKVMYENAQNLLIRMQIEHFDGICFWYWDTTRYEYELKEWWIEFKGRSLKRIGNMSNWIKTAPKKKLDEKIEECLKQHTHYKLQSAKLNNLIRFHKIDTYSLVEIEKCLRKMKMEQVENFCNVQKELMTKMMQFGRKKLLGESSEMKTNQFIKHEVRNVGKFGKEDVHFFYFYPPTKMDILLNRCLRKYLLTDLRQTRIERYLNIRNKVYVFTVKEAEEQLKTESFERLEKHLKFYDGIDDWLIETEQRYFPWEFREKFSFRKQIGRLWKKDTSDK